MAIPVFTRTQDPRLTRPAFYWSRKRIAIAEAKGWLTRATAKAYQLTIDSVPKGAFTAPEEIPKRYVPETLPPAEWWGCRFVPPEGWEAVERQSRASRIKAYVIARASEAK